METGSHIRLVLWKSAKAVEKLDRGSIAQTGLNLSDFAIMEVLLHKGPMTINRIGEKVLLTSGSMTTAVNRLQNSGLVERIQDPADGRCFFVHLTKTGRHVIRDAFENHRNRLESVAEILTEEERSELVRLLKKLGYHAETMANTAS
ncbi:Transcriptional regulator, MarR family [Olavius algarvensis associated proteobacterium Delta 3]|nr:Transcriptional regulator, MarR family [Olavius algarvensis associated proteobacterium Delta 3]CAB5167012.1 Transcriptional regulator, MarR family [Olavius algarvensis associated proteobacterium Delta 3]